MVHFALLWPTGSAGPNEHSSRWGDKVLVRRGDSLSELWRRSAGAHDHKMRQERACFERLEHRQEKTFRRRAGVRQALCVARLIDAALCRKGPGVGRRRRGDRAPRRGKRCHNGSRVFSISPPAAVWMGQKEFACSNGSWAACPPSHHKAELGLPS